MARKTGSFGRATYKARGTRAQHDAEIARGIEIDHERWQAERAAALRDGIARTVEALAEIGRAAVETFAVYRTERGEIWIDCGYESEPGWHSFELVRITRIPYCDSIIHFAPHGLTDEAAERVRNSEYVGRIRGKDEIRVQDFIRLP
jgi:hypothetical protein